MMCISKLCAVNMKIAMQWRRSVVKYGGRDQSGEAIRLFQMPRKIVLSSVFDRSFILDDVKLAVLSI